MLRSERSVRGVDSARSVGSVGSAGSVGSVGSLSGSVREWLVWWGKGREERKTLPAETKQVRICGLKDAAHIVISVQAIPINSKSGSVTGGGGGEAKQIDDSLNRDANLARVTITTPMLLNRGQKKIKNDKNEKDHDEEALPIDGEIQHQNNNINKDNKDVINNNEKSISNKSRKKSTKFFAWNPFSSSGAKIVSIGMSPLICIICSSLFNLLIFLYIIDT